MTIQSLKNEIADLERTLQDMRCSSGLDFELADHIQHKIDRLYLRLSTYKRRN